MDPCFCTVVLSFTSHHHRQVDPISRDEFYPRGPREPQMATADHAILSVQFSVLNGGYTKDLIRKVELLAAAFVR